MHWGFFEAKHLEFFSLNQDLIAAFPCSEHWHSTYFLIPACISAVKNYVKNLESKRDRVEFLISHSLTWKFRLAVQPGEQRTGKKTHLEPVLQKCK